MSKTALALALSSFSLAAQAAAPGDEVPDLTFPTFSNGDGRQKLSEFLGQPVLVVTFADVWGGTAASDRAVKLDEQYGKQGLVVILTHIASGGTYEDGANKVDLGAWAMRRYPGADVRLCDLVKPTWSWTDLGMPPYYAVIGADGRLVGVGNCEKGTKALEQAVQAAMKQHGAGWGEGQDAAVRALLFSKGQLAAARTKAPAAMIAEVDAVFARRNTIVEWLLADGQWQRARSEALGLAAASEGIAEWSTAVEALLARFADDVGKRELDLDLKLERLLAAVAKKGPDKATPRKLQELAKKAEGTGVGARADRLAGIVEQAVAIR